MPMTRSCRGLPREHRRFTSALAACSVASPADTLAMIGAACAQLGERALVVRRRELTSATSRISTTSRWWAR